MATFLTCHSLLQFVIDADSCRQWMEVCISSPNRLHQHFARQTHNHRSAGLLRIQPPRLLTHPPSRCAGKVALPPMCHCMSCDCSLGCRCRGDAWEIYDNLDVKIGISNDCILTQRGAVAAVWQRITQVAALCPDPALLHALAACSLPGAQAQRRAAGARKGTGPVDLAGVSAGSVCYTVRLPRGKANYT